MNTAREEILKKLNTSVHPVSEPADFEQPVFPPVVFPLEQTFKTQLEAIGGKVDVLASEIELYKVLKTHLLQFHRENIFCNEPENF